MFIAQPDKTKAAIALLKTYKNKRVILFARTKRGCDRIAKRLNANGLSAQPIHGNRSQNQRTRTLDAFRAGEVDILVATDVAARGIDIPGVELVLNFDLPQVAEAYVHRIGRTGRAGKSGTAIAFCNDEESAMLRDIEKIIKQRIPVRKDDGKVEAQAQWDPTKNPKAERTFDHLKQRDTEAYEPDSHQGEAKGPKGHDKQGFGEKRKAQPDPKNTPRKRRRKKPKSKKPGPNIPEQKNPKQEKPTANPPKRKRRNRPGSKARKRQRAERAARGGES